MDKVLEYFREFAAIPHGSYNEEKISDYLYNWGKDNGFETYRDAAKNVIIIAEATEDMKDKEPLIIQGHMDMVCEKDADCTKDMEKEGLDLEIDGDYLFAKGTTLGGDDGVALAMAMALIMDREVSHPRIECVFTVSEEVGMDGAKALDVSPLKGKKLINIDSEVEGIFTVGCAGGCMVHMNLPVASKQADGKIVKILISGLTGGHSGVEIHHGRANAIKELGELLGRLSDEISFDLVSVNGGSKDNAIAVSSEAVLFVKNEDFDLLKSSVIDFKNEKSTQFKDTDPALDISIEECKMGAAESFDEQSTKRVITLLKTLPNGVCSKYNEEMVKTSLNLGVLKTENQAVKITLLARSGVNAECDELVDQVEKICADLGGTYTESGKYPAWEYNEKSVLQKQMTEVYEDMYGKKPVIEVIHAGLECGMLGAKIEGLDAVSIGPNILEIHTPREKLSLSSTQRVYAYLRKLVCSI